jgi:hypothetical protein
MRTQRRTQKEKRYGSKMHYLEDESSKAHSKEKRYGSKMHYLEDEG